MFTKLNSSLQTKNYLGLSDADLELLQKDVYFRYLREPAPEILAEKGGVVLTLTGLSTLNVHRDCVASIQPNPELHEFGLVSYNSLFTGSGNVQFKIRPYKSGILELDYLYEIRLIR